jgi:hypothetical protein
MTQVDWRADYIHGEKQYTATRRQMEVVVVDGDERDLMDLWSMAGQGVNSGGAELTGAARRLAPVAQRPETRQASLWSLWPS